jgi:hypothetical protein
MNRFFLGCALAANLAAASAMAGSAYMYVPAGAKAEAERECSACHDFIPPQEEPMQEWRDILRNLPNHMGEVATLPEPLRSDIEAYLVANASDGPARRQSR